MIHIVIGTRAQLIKMIPVMVQLESNNMNWRWIYTFQHKESIKQLLDYYSIRDPDYKFNNAGEEAVTKIGVMRWFFRALCIILFQYRSVLGGKLGKSSVVIVHGDTFSTWLGAVLGKIGRCRVMHVESGLRSYNLLEPFPEEINRLLTFFLSDIYVCPGRKALKNVASYSGVKINTHYNTLIDMLRITTDKECECVLNDTRHDKFVVVSIHRFENIFNYERMKLLAETVSKLLPDYRVIFVLHPVTKKRVLNSPFFVKLLSDPNFICKQRMVYFEFVQLIKQSEFVISDGGSNQEELFYLGVPCLLFRKCTERPEGLGINVIISNYDIKKISYFLKRYKSFKKRELLPVESPTSLIMDNLKNY